ncbi:MAG: hypothetical protein ACI8Q1_000171 [Parvicella sp.]|jgi:hypothetical protein
MKIIFAILLSTILSGVFTSASAGGEWGEPGFLRPIPELNTIKTGLLVGAQKGIYFGAEFGWERQWKEIKLKRPMTYAISAVAEYQFKSDILGFRVGPWIKFGRLDFSYGLNAVVLSDFRMHKFGLSPSIGFKLIGFHLLAGYNIMLGNPRFIEYNKLHLSLRYYISKDREFYWKNKKKKKSKD